LPVEGSQHSWIMADEQQSRALLTAQTAQQLQSFLRVSRIQVARGLVCQHHARTPSQGPSEGHALLLPNGQLVRPVLQTVPESQGLE
jgi:hypothetical protein